MLTRSIKFVLCLVLFLISQSRSICIVALAQETKRPFTIADDIELAVFAGSSGSDEGLLFSPDGNYFVIETERGRLDLNRPEGTLRFYRSGDIADFLSRSNQSQLPLPVWVVNRSTNNEGRIFKSWRWLPDSSGVAFLERLPGNAGQNYQLVLADLRNRTLEQLTSSTEAVDQFDIRDRQHYVYTATDPVDRQDLASERSAPSIVGTGRSLNQLVLPDDPRTIQYYSQRTFYLWAFIDGKRFAVKQDSAGLTPGRGLALSPDGTALVASLPVPNVPASWETLFPPPFASDAYRLRAGQHSAYQYVRIDLRAGSVHRLTDAPISNGAGLWEFSFSNPSWSSDGELILLPGTFLKPKDNEPSRPCVAVIKLRSGTRTCVEILKGQTQTGVEEGFHHIQEARFVGGDSGRVLIRFHNHPNFYSLSAVEYRLASDGSWRVAKQTSAQPGGVDGGLQITIKEGLNEPPLLVASHDQTSRVIWDPNPQLQNVGIDRAVIYTWKDKEGRNWRGGLFKPHNYKSGQRYPLVIQTHGFTESKFVASGVFPTAFAARALAAVGIAVLQIPESEICPIVTLGEGPCVVAGYEAAIKQLVSEGLVDPEQIGIIGFSRTCFYVMEALTSGSLHLKAASITDGFLVGYLQYLLDVGTNEANSMMGAPPFGEGLQQWLRRSPEFNLDKVKTPLLVVAAGPNGVLQMWEPYAGLRYLQKPVDLIMLNTDEHVLTSPAVRLASQGGSVDWFRFWLQGYEDPDPAKREQYTRWRELRKLQEKNEASRTGSKQ